MKEAEQNETNALRAANMGLRATIKRMEAEKLAYESHVLAQYASYDHNLHILRTEVSRYKAVEAEKALKALEPAPTPGETAAPGPTGVVR